MTPDYKPRGQVFEDYAVVGLVSFLAAWTEALNELLPQVSLIYSKLHTLDSVFQLHLFDSLLVRAQLVKSLLLPLVNEVLIILVGEGPQ